MCCYFYSLSKILLTYCMYIIVNKATFMVNDTIKVINKYNIKLINTTSLSDSKLSSKVATQLLISFSILFSIVHLYYLSSKQVEFLYYFMFFFNSSISFLFLIYLSSINKLKSYQMFGHIIFLIYSLINRQHIAFYSFHLNYYALYLSYLT